MDCDLRSRTGGQRQSHGRKNKDLFHSRLLHWKFAESLCGTLAPVAIRPKDYCLCKPGEKASQPVRLVAWSYLSGMDAPRKGIYTRYPLTPIN
jgi:hypothetical protein